MEVIHESLLRRLEADLETYDLIYLIPDEAGLAEELSGRAGAGRILILSPFPVDGENVRQISREDCQALRRLYSLYEFSDRFQVLARDRRFGGLLNLTDAGVLSREELLSALTV